MTESIFPKGGEEGEASQGGSGSATVAPQHVLVNTSKDFSVASSSHHPSPIKPSHHQHNQQYVMHSPNRRPRERISPPPIASASSSSYDPRTPTRDDGFHTPRGPPTTPSAERRKTRGSSAASEDVRRPVAALPAPHVGEDANTAGLLLERPKQRAESLPPIPLPSSTHRRQSSSDRRHKHSGGGSRSRDGGSRSRDPSREDEPFTRPPIKKADSLSLDRRVTTTTANPLAMSAEQTYSVPSGATTGRRIVTLGSSHIRHTPNPLSQPSEIHAMHTDLLLRRPFPHDTRASRYSFSRGTEADDNSIGRSSRYSDGTGRDYSRSRGESISITEPPSVPPSVPPPRPPSADRSRDRSLVGMVDPSDEYVVRGGLGYGGYSLVVRAEHRTTAELYALKVVAKKKLKKSRDKHRLRNEIAVLTLDSPSPFLVSCAASFESDSYVFLVCEYLSGGDLFYHMQTLWSSGRFLGEETAKIVLAEIVLGMDHLHSHNFVHRDLKIENVMIDQNGHVKIIDFGLCHRLSHRDSSEIVNIAGSILYMAPEMVNTGRIGVFTDYWSLGILAYELLSPSGSLPWSGVAMGDSDEIRREVLRAGHTQVVPPSDVGASAGSLILGLLNPLPENRLGSASCRQLKSSSFFRSINWASLERREGLAPVPHPQTPPADDPTVAKSLRRYCRITPDQPVSLAEQSSDQHLLNSPRFGLPRTRKKPEVAEEEHSPRTAAAEEEEGPTPP